MDVVVSVVVCVLLADLSFHSPLSTLPWYDLSPKVLLLRGKTSLRWVSASTLRFPGRFLSPA